MAKAEGAHDRAAARTIGTAPPEWQEAMERAEADLRAGRVHEIDLDALCHEIEAEAREMETAQHREAS